MEVKLKELTVRELIEDYQDNSEEGVSYKAPLFLLVCLVFFELLHLKS